MKKNNTENEKNFESNETTSDDEHEIEAKSSEPEEVKSENSSDEEISNEEVENPKSVEPETKTVSLEDQLHEYEDRFLRLAAEFDNYKRRMAKQVAVMIKSAQTTIISELLTIQDNFERALEIDMNSTDLADFKKGVELIFSQFSDLLKRNGVEPFESVGKKFDPNLHEAVMTVESDDKEDGTIIEEFSKGYKLKDRILRHAKVSVAQAKN